MHPNSTSLSVRAPKLRWFRRGVAALGALVIMGFLGVSPHAAVAMPVTNPGAVHVDQVASSTTTSEALAGTTLEADSRSDGTAVAPWLIWSGVAAGASVLVGGLLLKRRMS